MADAMNGVRIALLAAALLCTGSVPAQDAERQTPPEGGVPKDFTLPAKQQFRLENGLKVTLVPFGKIPKATVSAQVIAGNLNEGENTWLADLTADMMEQGTASRSAEQVAREAAEMGGSLSISVGLDQTAVTGEALAEFVPGMVALLADVLRNPALPETELERLRRDAQRNLEVALNDPDSMGQAAFYRALYGDHPYGRLFPTEAQLASYSTGQIRDFYQANFGAQRTHLFVVGMFDMSAVKSAIEQALGSWEPGPGPLQLPPQPAAERQYVDIIDRASASQSNLFLGLPTIDPSHPDYIALQATNTMLGGSFSSRITSNIREDKGYTYSPFSQVSVRRNSGHWVQQAAVTTDDTAAALKEIYFEIERLRDEAPPAEELRAIQNYLAGVFTLRNSTRGGIINVLNQVDLHGLDDSYLTEYVSRVYALTPEEISRTATEYLRPADMTLVVVGDRARIGEDLAKYVDPP